MISIMGHLCRLHRPTASVSRVAGVEDSYAGKTRPNYTNLCWGAAVATSAAIDLAALRHSLTRETGAPPLAAHLLVWFIIAPTHSKSKTGTPTGADAQARAAASRGSRSRVISTLVARMLSVGHVSTPIRTLHARIGIGLECDSLTSGGSYEQDQTTRHFGKLSRRSPECGRARHWGARDMGLCATGPRRRNSEAIQHLHPRL